MYNLVECPSCQGKGFLIQRYLSKYYAETGQDEPMIDDELEVKYQCPWCFGKGEIDKLRAALYKAGYNAGVY